MFRHIFQDMAQWSDSDQSDEEPSELAVRVRHKKE